MDQLSAVYGDCKGYFDVYGQELCQKQQFRVLGGSWLQNFQRKSPMRTLY